jgi:hypothetical protein
MAHRGVLIAFFFAQSVIGLFHIQSAIELAGFAAVERPS